MLCLIINFQMSFDRIQKFRSEKTVSQFHHIKTSLRVPNKEITFNAGNQNFLSQSSDERIQLRQQMTANSCKNISTKGITLRDYLYLNSNSSSTSTSREKTHKISQQKGRNNSKSQTKYAPISSHHSRKEKDLSQNTEIFEIIKKDIIKDLGSLKILTEELNKGLNSIEFKKLSSKQMIQIYTLRKSVRENILNELARLNKITKSIKKSNQQQIQHSMPVILENDQDERHEYLLEQKVSSSSKRQKFPQSTVHGSFSVKF